MFSKGWKYSSSETQRQCCNNNKKHLTFNNTTGATRKESVARTTQTQQKDGKVTFNTFKERPLFHSSYIRGSRRLWSA